MTRQHRTRTLWMAKLDDAVRLVEPGLSGRIDWNTATFLFNSGRTPEEAAVRLVINEAERQQRMVAAFVSEGLGE